MSKLDALARGHRAREARRRAEKAEKRRLEAAEVLANADATMDAEADAASVDPIDASPANLNGATLANRTDARQLEADLARIGLVTGVQRGGELSLLIDGAACSARFSRELLQQQVGVAVGDRVQVVPGKDGRRAVVDIEPRRTRLARIREDRSRRSGFSREEAVLAANVDVAVIVAAVAQPAFHPKLVDRFLVICQYGGIRPLLCLNKCDLVESPPDVAIYEQLGLPIVYTSAASGAGLDELRGLLRGQIAVFTGHSGVGKSSLVNALLGD